jgi:site-specific DNA-methyltransferase (adenine-specific)/modification methylase
MAEIVTIGDATLYLGDCMDILPTLPKVDAVITDPPYGIADDYLKPSNKGEWSNLYSEKITWDSFAPDEAVSIAISLSSKAIVWGGNYFKLPPQRGWLIWDKMQSHTSGHAELAWTNINIPIRSFAYSRAQLSNEHKQHPTQKPIGLMAWCIDLAGNPKTILDPFMGSGTTGVAAIQMGSKFIGIERETKYFDIACKRIEQATKQEDMFIPKMQQEQVSLIG